MGLQLAPCGGGCCPSRLSALAAFGTDLADRDALAVLAAAPSPDQGRRLSQTRIETLLRKAGRQRNLATTAAKIKTALGSEQLTARPGVVPAYAASASALIAVLVTLMAQTEGWPGRWSRVWPAPGR
jgi:hypothetical protein